MIVEKHFSEKNENREYVVRSFLLLFKKMGIETKTASAQNNYLPREKNMTPGKENHKERNNNLKNMT
ncbi:MAG: hypothetical protein ACOY31_01975 [Bacillota bacterium]